MSRPIRAAILTVSDTCAQDHAQDKAGPQLVGLFQRQEKRTWMIAATAICADVVGDIQSIVRRWVDDDAVDVVVTTGGTGFAVRDVTPEAVRPLLDKEAPGLVHAMFRTSFDITPFAAMARVVAGIRKGSIIVTVPGSIKGATENLEAIIKLLPHASDLASDTYNSRALHAGGMKQIEEQAGLTRSESTTASSITRGHHDPKHHNHAHAHVSNDPALAVTKRARESPYAMTSVEDALNLVVQNTPDPLVSSISLYGHDNDYLVADHFVAEDIYAREEVPAYRASIVDGYAVISGDGPGTYPVVSISHANPSTVPDLKKGQIARITTGAPLPPGADSVIMVEYTKLVASTEDGKEEKEVQILVPAPVGDNIREAGSDLQKGTLVMAKGERVSSTGGEVGVLASSGHAKIPIYRKPVVGVLSTGDELIDPKNSKSLRPGEIRDSNRVSLLTTLRAHHFSPIDLGIAGDTNSSLEKTLRDAIDRCDVIITTGGVSMGELDLLKPTIERTLGGTIHFGRVAMKPGKPTTFATIPRANLNSVPDRTDKVLVFALPGNPASALVTYNLFVLPALRLLSGQASPAGPTSAAIVPKVKVVLGHDIKLDPRPEFHRVTLKSSESGVMIATSTGMQRSSRVGSLRCTAVLCLPARMDNLSALEQGTVCDAIMVDRL